MSTAETPLEDRASWLLERLLIDAEFRAEFRRAPVSVCKACALPELAEELATAAKGLQTLEMRESRSSLAGVLLAAAMEGVSVASLLQDARGPAAQVVEGALTRSGMTAVQMDVAREEVPGANGAAAAEANGAGAPEADAPAGEAGADAAGAGAAAGEAGAPEPDAAAAGAGDLGASVEPASPSALSDADMGRGAVPGVVGGPEPAAGAEIAAAPVAAAPVVAVPEDAAGGGGAAAAAAEAPAAGGGGGLKAVLDNPKLDLPPDARKDLMSEDADPRLLKVLDHMLKDHEIRLSVVKTGHDKFTSGGSVSNHWHTRAIDIASVDGEIVRPGSGAARTLASEIAELPADLRPKEVGTPWAIAAPGFFTDAGHQDHIHVGYGEAPPGSHDHAEHDHGADEAAPAAAPVPAAPAADPAVAAAPAAAAPAAAATPAAPVADPAAAAPSAAPAAQPAAPAPAAPAEGGRLHSAVFGAVESGPAESNRPQTVQLGVAEPPKEGAIAGAAVDADAGGGGGAVAGPDDYPGDDAPREQIAAWMAAKAEKAGLPPELPVMAALVESDLKNLNHGHADSVGFFQMRVGIWNQGEYAGYPEDPEKQIKWFIDHAKAAQSGRDVKDSSQWGEWIADTERPAEQYRGRYQTKLEEAQALLKDARGAAAPAAPAAAAPGAVLQAVPAGAAAPAGAEAPAAGGAADAAAAGGGGGGVKALLENKRLTVDADAKMDLLSDKMDPRAVAVLERLLKDHEISLSVLKTGHPRGPASNHFHYRGVDIATVDGEIVRPNSPASKKLMEELGKLPASIRPSEIGGPWVMQGAGYFTDAGHQDHIHFGFDDEAPKDFKAPAAPAGGAAAPAAAAAAAAPAAPGAPAAPAEPSDGRLHSATFAAVEEDTAPKDARQTIEFAVVPHQDGPGATQDGDEAERLLDAPEVGPDKYPGDDASKEEIAGWMAQAAHKAGLPGELPVMAGLVESGLSNLNHGDADSIGFFQMRVSIWDRGAYAGYGEQPEKQLKWFLEQAVALKKKRIAENPNFGENAEQWGEWIADVERPAEQYRGRYQTKLEEARGLLDRWKPPDGEEVAPAAAAAPAPQDVAIAPAQPGAPAAAAAAAPAPAAAAPADLADAPPGVVANERGSAKAEAALKEAFKHKGTAYKWGGMTPETGFDCSGLMQWAYKEQGIDIPRVTYDQVNAGEKVERNDLRAGDLILFSSPGGDIHHVGMYVGNDKFLHAPSTGDVVKVSSLDEPYYKSQFHMGRRIDGGAPAAGAAEAAAAAPAAGDAAIAAAAAPAAAGAPAPVALEEVPGEEGPKRQTATFKAAEPKAAEGGKRHTVQFMQAVESDAAEKPTDPAAPPAEVQAFAARAAPGAEADALDADAVASFRGMEDYPGDDAPRAEIAGWMAQHAKKAGLPPELPIMAALVESNLHNVNHGDADSLGYFQMRTSIWNKGPYAGFPSKPELQLKWFIDNAKAAKGGRDVKDSSQWGEWIADTERPAAQYRGRYQLRLAEARRLLKDLS